MLGNTQERYYKIAHDIIVLILCVSFKFLVFCDIKLFRKGKVIEYRYPFVTPCAVLSYLLFFKGIFFKKNFWKGPRSPKFRCKTLYKYVYINLVHIFNIKHQTLNVCVGCICTRLHYIPLYHDGLCGF